MTKAFLSFFLGCTLCSSVKIVFQKRPFSRLWERMDALDAACRAAGRHAGGPADERCGGTHAGNKGVKQCALEANDV